MVKAYLVGVYEQKISDTKIPVLTSFGDKINKQTNGRLLSQLNVVGSLRFCKTRIFYDLSHDYPIVISVGLGPVDASFDKLNNLNEAKENIRSAIGSAINAIRELDAIDHVFIDGCGDPLSVSEGANLAIHCFDYYKDQELKSRRFTFELAEKSPEYQLEWQRGEILAFYQNECRDLMETPANLLTPTIFSEKVKQICESLNVQVIVHDEKWALEKKMGSFLSVAKGSDEPPKFVELHYKNANNKPIVFVGKGITFDSGGISLKPSLNMDSMRADMGGAANVFCTIAALAKLNAKVNIIGLIPLTENLPSGKASKPGDVVFASNGKSIQINNTDAEGRLILADALCYADTFDPFLVVDVATLTGAIGVALGAACSGVYSTNDDYWKILRNVGIETGDRVWRMPLFSDYLKKTKDSVLADLVNISKEPSYGAGSPIAAAFLKEFVTCSNWIHIDIAGSMMNSGDICYLSKGMSGRPLRTLVNFFEKLSEQTN